MFPARKLAQILETARQLYPNQVVNVDLCHDPDEYENTIEIKVQKPGGQHRTIVRIDESGEAWMLIEDAQSIPKAVEEARNVTDERFASIIEEG